MNRKGQALIEFVVIIPIFLLLILSVVDFGNVLMNKYQLENHLDYIRQMYNNEEYVKIENYIKKNSLEYEIDTFTSKIVVTKKVTITAPGLNTILGNPHTIKSEGYIYE